MVRLKGPMSSAEASGTFGGAASFATWKGRAYAKRKSIPSNPKTAMQVSARAMMAFLVQRWSELPSPARASWTQDAAAAQISPYNQYLAANLNRWREFQAPSQATPAAETGTVAEIDDWNATGGVAKATLYGLWYGVNDGWGLIIFRSTSSSFTPSRSNAIAIVKHTSADYNFYVDEGLAPGTYYYNVRSFTKAGKLSSAYGQKTAIVT